MLDKSVYDKAQVALIRARIQLLSSNPFWAHLVLKMPLKWMENVVGGISCTDGESMFINPKAFLAMSKGEQVSMLVHEAAHCAAMHLFRRGSRDGFRFNVAGDVYIANMLEADGFTTIQASEAFLAQQGINRRLMVNQTTETIYELLPKSVQGQDKGKSDQGGCQHWQGEGGCYKPAEASSASKSELEAQWKQNVVEAGQLAGNQPGAWSELVKAATPKPPFHLKLFEYLARGLGGDADWAALNRRHIHEGTYLPNDTRIVMGEIAIVVDTSGSMSAAQLTEAFGYVRAFRDEHPCKLHLIQCDYDVPEGTGYKLYEEWDAVPAEIKVNGRGGTSFDPPFKHVREKRIEPRVLIYMTDGFGSVSEKRPPYPVLWVMIAGDREFKPPFGEVVYAKLDK